ncbi:hypothetical protein SAMN05446935_0361 [Burkholderia sp. YR290]|nr:hypothetical protein SAMN05446935_0361 [Burkholderia sp. YR290]
MLRITVELVPPMGPTKVLATAEVENTGGDEKYADYAVRLAEDADEHDVRTGVLKVYPRFGGSIWDLVARGIATALAGKEELPPRPVFPWR